MPSVVNLNIQEKKGFKRRKQFFTFIRLLANSRKPEKGHLREISLEAQMVGTRPSGLACIAAKIHKIDSSERAASLLKHFIFEQ